MRAAILARFWSLVDRSKAKACWPFRGYVASHGYGQFTFGLERVRAHRFSWLVSRGEIPAGQNVCHRCDNPRCVNPSHLYLGTQAANMHDALRKGRKKAWGQQKLDAEQVLSIRAQTVQGVPQKDIAAAFGIARNTVSGIVNGRSWAHLSSPSSASPSAAQAFVDPSRAAASRRRASGPATSRPVSSLASCEAVCVTDSPSV